MFAATQSGTTWFGGTVWAADSMRWEAIEGQLWTFESGVGSSIVPPGGPDSLSSPTRDWINPYKASGLHATMEGWIGFDYTYSDVPYFRRLSSQDSRWSEDVCVGTPAGLGGAYSFWCGAFSGEADSQCFGTGQGYGNSWVVCIEHPFNYNGGGITLQFKYRNETEPDYDYTIVYVDSSGNGTDVEATSFTGMVSGIANVALVQGVHLPETTPATIKLKFCVQTDGAWSDQDGLNPTACGAFAMDDVTVSGGGIAHSTGFETGPDGWTLSAPSPGQGGEWASLHHVSDLPPMLVPCPCAVYDSVLAFPDDTNGHNRFTDNLAASPWIDLKAAGKVGAPGKIFRFNIYADIPLLNYIFTQQNMQWYPEACFNTGKLVTSPWTSQGFYYLFGSPPTCTRPGEPSGTKIDFSGVVPVSAQQVRIAVGVLSYCRFFANCTQTANTSPWYDQVALGVYGVPGAPIILVDTIDSPQDNFPENGTSFLYATGRVDSNNIQGDSQPEVGTTLGDTMMIQGAQGGAEVYVHFRVQRGPRTDSRRFNEWYYSHPVSPMDPGFRAARCDTAERGNSGPISGNWMTAYHEADPNFEGSDEDVDPSDVAPNGGLWRLQNDIFPDDLFTAGTRMDCFFSANFVGNPASYRTPLAPATYEMEILPSSYNGNDQWNCVLYVDHFNRGAQGYIENALTEILGTSSANFEGTNWDRFDVNAESSQQMSFGRPLNTEYGATLLQALAYKVILWNSGNLNAFNLTKEDADVLVPWLTLTEFGDNSLYLSGDGIVYSPLFEGESEPSAAHLIANLAGIGLTPGCATGAFRASGCGTPGVVDVTPCVSLDPVVGAQVAGTDGGRTVTHYGQGNGCPGPPASFDVLSVETPDWGVAVGDERYVGGLKSADFASVVTDASPSGVLNYKIVTDGISVHYRRDTGSNCTFVDSADAVTDRLREVLTYFGLGLNPDLCFDRTAGTGLTNLMPPQPVFVTRLLGLSPNPLLAGTPGRIRFTLAREGRAVVEVYDIQGRRVKTVFDGLGTAGLNEVMWSGTDETSNAVGSGVYFYRLHAEGVDSSERVVVISKGRN